MDLSPIAVIGAGAMGAGIAQVAAERGFDILLHDVRDGAAHAARAGIGARLDRAVAKGTMTADAAREGLARIRPVAAIADLAPARIAIEAVVEDLAVKAALFRDLEAVLADDAILASNTSSLSIGAIAAGCRRPGRVVGLHFFNPVPLMRLVEVVAGLGTDPAVVDQVRGLAEKLGKVAVTVRDTPGFLVNLAGRAYTQEALHILEEGVAGIAAIDTVLRDACGFRMGPFELLDLTGMDVNVPVSRTVFEGFGHDPRLRTTPGHVALLAAGRLGRKTGQGFYTYDADGRRVDPPAAPAIDAVPAPRVVIDGPAERMAALLPDGTIVLDQDDGASPILAAFEGEDCTGYALRRGLDPLRLVGIDLLPDTSRVVTLMAAPGADPAMAGSVAAAVAATGRTPVVIRDSAGFIAQRVLAMIVNLAAEIAQAGIATPDDIDRGVTLGLNYPVAPFAWADTVGPARLHAILQGLQVATGFDRYRPSLWLRRRALLGLPLATP